MFRHVALELVPPMRAPLEAIGLRVDGADQSRDIRSCTGGPICSLAVTPAQTVAADLINHPALDRNSGLRVHVSGCPNVCAQHQIADLGFSGGMVTIAGRQLLGYQVWLGGDLRTDALGKVVGRVAEADVSAMTETSVGIWEALRENRETLSSTANRFEPAVQLRAAGWVLQLRIDAKHIALANWEGTMYALDDSCSHTGEPLGNNRLQDGCYLECPGTIPLSTLEPAKSAEGPARKPQTMYSVKVENGTVFVAVD